MTVEYIDYRGWRYKVKSGIGCNIFKPPESCSGREQFLFFDQRRQTL